MPEQEFKTPQEALAHYGVKGMKWGVRNDRGSGSNAAGSDGAAIGIITAVYAGIMIMQARHNYVDSGKKHQNAINKEAKKSGVEHSWKKNDDFSGPKTVEQLVGEVVPGINKGFPDTPGTSMNCRRCTFTYEMRRRGYDVEATKSLSATGQDAGGLKAATSPTKVRSRDVNYMSWGDNEIATSSGNTPAQNAASVFGALKSQPNGSRGELAFGWKYGGGHSVAYEIVNNNPVILCTQTKRTWSNTTDFAREVGPIMDSSAFTRLDNANLNDDFLKRWVTNA